MENDEIIKDKNKKEYYKKEFGKSFEIDNISIDISKLPLLKYILRELFKTFTEEQRVIFEKYWEVENKTHAEIEEQIFMYGFIMAQELENEKNIIKTNKLLK